MYETFVMLTEKLGMTEMLQQNASVVDECIDACQACHRICLETAAYCFEQGGRSAEPAYIALLLACAERCQTNIDFMARESHYYTVTCAVCRDVCQQCADTFRRFAGDSQLQRCAQCCQQCADLCQAAIEQTEVSA